MDFEKNVQHPAFICLTENIQRSVDDKQIVCGVFIDLEKTLDSVGHTLLLNIILLKQSDSIYFHQWFQFES